MRVFTQAVTDSASMTCYVQDPSADLANARIRPAVMILPGGAYQFCSGREAEPIALGYLGEGFNAFVLRYAVGADAPWEQSFVDGKAGLAWLRAHAGEMHIDPARIAAVGFSAGGHLAASLGTAADGRPDALVLGYPVTLAEFGPLVGKQILDIPSAVDPATPPTFLFSTQGDTLVPIRHSLVLLSALAEHDIPFETHIYLLGGHGLSLAKPLTSNGQANATDAAVAGWLRDSIRFLDRVFGTFPVEGTPRSYQGLLESRQLGLDMPIDRLLAHPEAAAAVTRRLPGLVEQLNPLLRGATLRELSVYDPELSDPAALQLLSSDLAALAD